MERWREYCENLYSDSDNDGQEQVRMGGNLEPTPSLEEVEKAIKSMKPGKAAGPDEIPAQLLKLGEYTVNKAMHKVIKQVGKQANGRLTGLSPLSFPFTRKVIQQYAPTIVRYL